MYGLLKKMGEWWGIDQALRQYRWIWNHRDLNLGSWEDEEEEDDAV